MGVTNPLTNLSTQLPSRAASYAIEDMQTFAGLYSIKLGNINFPGSVPTAESGPPSFARASRARRSLGLSVGGAGGAGAALRIDADDGRPDVAILALLALIALLAGILTLA
jgi:hypothetical protein